MTIIESRTLAALESRLAEADKEIARLTKIADGCRSDASRMGARALAAEAERDEVILVQKVLERNLKAMGDAQRRTAEQRNAAEAEAKRLREALDVAEDIVCHLFSDMWRRSGWSGVMPDHACGPCVTSGPMVIEGFRCRYHRAMDILHGRALADAAARAALSARENDHE